MIEPGNMNQLRISRISTYSCFLDGGEWGEVMLIKGFRRAEMKVGDSLEVFVYVDSDESLLATVHKPKILAGQCAALRVVNSTDSGSYLDLFVPRSELAESVAAGELVVALGLIDDSNRRMIGSTRLYKHLPMLNEGVFEPDQAVELLISQQTELGFKAVINGSHLGVLYHSEVFQPLSIGQTVAGYISPKLREDGRIDLKLNQISQASRDDLEGRILQQLQSTGGVSTITDKSPPDEIYTAFAVSKKAYKKALGGLYRKKLVTLEKTRVTLNKQ
jgi:predicted RNA-binding protein (virulence factor B family)